MSSEMSLLVLGGRSDIGLAIAYEFARHGFDIILAARNCESLKNAKSDIEIRHSVTVYLVEFDAADIQGHSKFYGDLPIRPEVVLYAAGYLGDQTLAQTDHSEAERIMTVNYSGAVTVLSAVANDYERRRAGTIIGIGSVAGDRGRQSNYLYGSAKAGFAIFLEGLRHRLVRSNVHVMTVKPGFVETRMTRSLNLPQFLTAQPPDVAARVFNSYRTRRNTLYVYPIWRLIMFGVRSLPERIFLKTKL